ncbi:1,4-dihydroxy-2-naphthoate octaprenyltransferase [Philodulcilactobacillus myokoensis]|uniref:1,4-dihydroxy-2-naphthoate octaprenyltransferase n=1 Tax=Philodulcilactobacillus myokoensis TaxID=2929573 RepID=A0A9W6AY26_9LACO|nr:UbiA family prenyltransferase [Philodulcilactobacillus myokoensis]GLB46060.1 1,4-dihydroxy-2-naphthoate octaprenyltransferase [Philodulcilactobacillus myokoensis]
MSIKSFLDLVNAKSLVATFLPLLFGIIFVQYQSFEIHPLLSLLFFIAVLCLQMFANTTDSIADHRRAGKLHVTEFFDHVNVLGNNEISEKMAIVIDGSLLFLVVLIGIILLFETTMWLLIIGLLGCAIAYFYDAGPLPISTTPFGEIVSGMTMGLGVIYAYIMINVPTSDFHLSFFGSALLASGMPILALANIMLANNICDLKEDFSLRRKTIVTYIGQFNSLKLYGFNYVLMYITLIMAVILNYLPAIMLITLLAIPFIWLRTKKFFKVHLKAKTFVLTIKNTLDLLLLTLIALVLKNMFGY